jgi:hypothetical protein
VFFAADDAVTPLLASFSVFASALGGVTLLVRATGSTVAPAGA